MLYSSDSPGKKWKGKKKCFKPWGYQYLIDALSRLIYSDKNTVSKCGRVVKQVKSNIMVLYERDDKDQIKGFYKCRMNLKLAMLCVVDAKVS